MVIENVTDPRMESSSDPVIAALDPNRVRWSSAAGLAGVVAGVASAMTVAVFFVPAAFPFAWLWTICGAVIVIGLYGRRHPRTPIDARLGARFGLLYGLIAVGLLGLTLASAGVLARFVMHTTAGLDAWLTMLLHQAVEQQSRQATQGIPPLTQDQLSTLYSPEIRAGMAVFLLTVASAFLVVFSTLGGAMGGMLYPRRQQRAN